MGAELVYQKDSYLREIYAKVTDVDKNVVYFDKTIFHPRSGGVDHDTGWIIAGDNKWSVVRVVIDKEKNDIAHVLDNESKLEPGTVVKQVINWDRRYKLMRLHTAAHIISALMYEKYKALITGGNISYEYAYDDYSLDIMDKNIFYDVVEEANKIVKRGIEVKIYWLPREEALKIPGIVKLAHKMPPDLKYLRIVEIPGIDIQADGGPHVKNTKEIGEIIVLKIVNKGKRRKRLYYTVRP